MDKGNQYGAWLFKVKLGESVKKLKMELGSQPFQLLLVKQPAAW